MLHDKILAADIALSVHLENIRQKDNQVYLPRRNHLKAAFILFSTVQRYQPEKQSKGKFNILKIDANNG